MEACFCWYRGCGNTKDDVAAPKPLESAKIPILPLIIGLGCMCCPSYVVTTIDGSSDDLSTLFFTPQPALVQR